jgi:hypothetical protein
MSEEQGKEFTDLKELEMEQAQLTLMLRRKRMVVVNGEIPGKFSPAILSCRFPTWLSNLDPHGGKSE